MRLDGSSCWEPSFPKFSSSPFPGFALQDERLSVDGHGAKDVRLLATTAWGYRQVDYIDRRTHLVHRIQTTWPLTAHKRFHWTTYVSPLKVRAPAVSPTCD